MIRYGNLFTVLLLTVLLRRLDSRNCVFRVCNKIKMAAGNRSQFGYNGRRYLGPPPARFFYRLNGYQVLTSPEPNL
jgi:hypothetical protein